MRHDPSGAVVRLVRDLPLRLQSRELAAPRRRQDLRPQLRRDHDARALARQRQRRFDRRRRDAIVTGVAGHGYGCRHGAAGNSSYIAVLGNDALDPECGPIFSSQTVPSGQALRLVERALGSANGDAFDSLVFTLFEQSSAAAAGSSGGTASGLRMQRVKRFIELHAFEQLAVRDVAAEVGLSPFTLVRQFRSAVGTSPYAYLLELRLARAKELLRTSDRSIGAVAERVGFRDPAYFSRLFASTVGCSPTEFRSDRNSRLREGANS
ncbi:MAG TPA: helix-turn-helix transcriptional regulator [Candidatus Elarobacter sp.]|nr:helix-turn-helix transcriptional regulator [Candidatus Elarobacter sp.]